MGKEVKKPRIRFEGFIDAWEQRKFGELADYKKGPFGSAITKDMFVEKSETSIKVYEQQNAINKDWTLERYFLPQSYVFSNLKSFEVHGGDVIVSCAGTIGEIYELPENAEAGVINQALMRVRVNENIIQKQMFIILFSNMIERFTQSHSNGSAIKNIPPFSDLKPMEVLVPRRDEQILLADYFAKLDHLITLHQRKYDKLQKIKKSMLQKMFPQNGSLFPEIRFEGFTDAWEQRKFSDLVIIERGGSPRPIEDFITDSADGLNWVKIGDAPEQGNYITKTAEKIRPEGLAKTREVHPGDLILSNSMSFGKPYIMGIDGCIHDGWLAIREVQRNFDLKFLCVLLGTNQMLEQYRSFAAGSTVNNLNKELVGSTTVSYPNKDEQRQIGEYFEQLDHLITLHQRNERMDLYNYAMRFSVKDCDFKYAWEQRKWSDVVDISTEMVDPRTGEFDELPHVAPGNIESFTGQLFDNVKLVKEENLVSGKFHFYNGDIIYGKINPQLGKYVFARFEGLTSADAYVLNAKNGIDQKYLFAVLQTKDFYDYSVSVSKRSGMPKINRNELNAYKFMAPSVEEQDMIGRVLLDLDHLITLHQRKLFARKWRKFNVKRSKKYRLLL